MAGVDGGGLGGGTSLEEHGADLFELAEAACGVAPSSAARAEACAAAAGARGPSTWPTGWESRSVTVRSPKQTAMC